MLAAMTIYIYIYIYIHTPLLPPRWAMNVQVLDKKVSYHKWPSKCIVYSLKTTQYFKFPKGERPQTPLESNMIFFLYSFII